MSKQLNVCCVCKKESECNYILKMGKLTWKVCSHSCLDKLVKQISERLEAEGIDYDVKLRDEEEKD